jgi:chromosome segregation ATPase
MTLLKNIKNCLLFVALSFFALPSTCVAEATYTITENQLITLESNLSELEQNNETLLSLLNGSETDLQIAKEQLSESAKEIEKLTAQLKALKAESERAQQSLEIANIELQNALTSVKQLEDKKRRIERQRNMWEVIALILGGIAITR